MTIPPAKKRKEIELDLLVMMMAPTKEQKKKANSMVM